MKTTTTKHLKSHNPKTTNFTYHWALRPAFFLRGSTRDFSGLFLVISSNVVTVAPRLPGDVGLYALIATSR
jgi:hypothetical protein